MLLLAPQCLQSHTYEYGKKVKTILIFLFSVAICGHHSYQEFLSKENLNFILHKSKLFHSLDGQER